MTKIQQRTATRQPAFRDPETPVWNEPQINWYREYLLQPDANAELEINDNNKQAFENSLYKKIWGKTLESGTNYPSSPESSGDTGNGPEPYYTFSYGLNDKGASQVARRGCEKTMIFGITFCHERIATTEGETTTYGKYEIKCGYLFIIAAYTQGDIDKTNDNIIVRTHQLVITPNTEFWDGPLNPEATGGHAYHGIRVIDGEIVFGIDYPDNPLQSIFYFPRKSFFLEGRHQDPVPFVEGYTGSFDFIFK